MWGHLAFSPTENLLAWTGTFSRWPSPSPSNAPDPMKTPSVTTTLQVNPIKGHLTSLMTKGYHFTDHFRYNLASLGECSIAFACQPENDHPSQVLFKPYTSWSSSSSQYDWTYTLGKKKHLCTWPCGDGSQIHIHTDGLFIQISWDNARSPQNLSGTLKYPHKLLLIVCEHVDSLNPFGVPFISLLAIYYAYTWNWPQPPSLLVFVALYCLQCYIWHYIRRSYLIRPQQGT